MLYIVWSRSCDESDVVARAPGTDVIASPSVTAAEAARIGRQRRRVRADAMSRLPFVGLAGFVRLNAGGFHRRRSDESGLQGQALGIQTARVAPQLPSASCAWT